MMKEKDHEHLIIFIFFSAVSASYSLVILLSVTRHLTLSFCLYLCTYVPLDVCMEHEWRKKVFLVYFCVSTVIFIQFTQWKIIFSWKFYQGFRFFFVELRKFFVGSGISWRKSLWQLILWQLSPSAVCYCNTAFLLRWSRLLDEK